MFTFDDNQFKEITDRMKDDLGEDLVDRLREEVIAIKSQYSKDLAGEIEYFENDKIVGSTTFGPHIVNEGLSPGTFPNFDRIKDWVINVKDKSGDVEKYGEQSLIEKISSKITGRNYTTLPDWAINKITYAVCKKIEREGIKPSWFVDRAISKLEGENP